MQEIEEREEGEAGANGGLASGTISTISAAAATASNAGEAKYSAGAVSERGKNQIEQKQMLVLITELCFLYHQSRFLGALRAPTST